MLAVPIFHLKLEFLSTHYTDHTNHTNHLSTPSAMASYPPLAEREVKNTVVLFDVDGTLTPARLVCPFPVLPHSNIPAAN